MIDFRPPQPLQPDMPFPATLTLPQHTPALQRAIGRGFAEMRVIDGRTRIAKLHQSGCVKLRFPASFGAGAEAILINSSGGLTGGDRLTQGFSIRAGAALTATSQACERVYRAVSGHASIETLLDVAAEANLAFLPQETILFDGGALARRLDVSFAASSRVLLVESVILGRRLMGERVVAGRLSDRWRLRRDGALVFADDLKFEGPVEALAERKAVLGGGGAFATVVLAAGDAVSYLAAARGAVGPSGGVSTFDGLLVARLVSDSGFALRKVLVPLLSVLANHPLPRVWSI